MADTRTFTLDSLWSTMGDFAIKGVSFTPENTKRGRAVLCGLLKAAVKAGTVQQGRSGHVSRNGRAWKSYVTFTAPVETFNDIRTVAASRLTK